jgi:hypothetical protein
MKENGAGVCVVEHLMGGDVVEGLVACVERRTSRSAGC